MRVFHYDRTGGVAAMPPRAACGKKRAREMTVTWTKVTCLACKKWLVKQQAAKAALGRQGL